MRDLYLSYTLDDNGGRRIGIERRRFSYAEHIPERRCGEDRRTFVERRSGMDRRVAADRRATERADRRETPSRRDVQEHRIGDDRRRLGLDRRKVPRSKKASSAKGSQDLQDLPER